jgi:hypothetical protein
VQLLVEPVVPQSGEQAAIRRAKADDRAAHPFAGATPVGNVSSICAQIDFPRIGSSISRLEAARFFYLLSKVVTAR